MYSSRQGAHNCFVIAPSLPSGSDRPVRAKASVDPNP
jgi:hypothetical protein